MHCATALALLGMALLPLSADPVKSSKSSRAKPVSAKSKPSAKLAGGRKASGRYRRSAPRPSYQVHPDPERYQQIQQALTDRGYFHGQVNGEWGDDSVDALKRFQADQKLENDGKINALTLTGLGLGPKHTIAPPVAQTAAGAPAGNQPAAPQAQGASEGPATPPL
ncbi:MAG: peptidoglycan-binding protein [Acidobacteriaceae bacterium]|nr:peptidoglycan-binding protein [Acidobacteriaceae bacterium]